MTTETEIVVRYAETDQMGIAHHSHYPVWFEAARTDFIKKFGISYSDIERRGVLLPLTDLACSYKKPARYEDILTIRTGIRRITCVRVVFGYEVILKDTGELLAEGETSHAWTDADLRPLNLKRHWPALYQMLEECTA